MKTPWVVAAGAYAAIRSALALLGLAALAATFVLPLRADSVAPQLEVPTSAPPSADVPRDAAPLQAVAATPAETAAEREQREVTEYIAKRWRVAESAVAQFVSIAYRAGEQHRVDPLLILAVMAVESRYNPVAESVVGAKGLMQVMPQYHQEKLLDHGGDHAVLEPEVNIHVGAQILREYSRRFGDLETALQMYAGALDEPTSQYATKVFAEKARLDVLRAKTRKSGQSA